MKLVELTPAAEAEAMQAAIAYETERFGLGYRFEVELDRVLSRIAQAPLQFPAIDDSVRRALLRVFPFAVLFTVLADRIRVFAILHQHRHPDTWRRH